MDSQTRRVYLEVSRFCDRLTARRESTGAIHVYEKTVGWEPFYFNDQKFLIVRPNYELVFPLTHNWRVDGKPIEYGLEVVLDRLKQHDIHVRDKFLEEIRQQNEKIDEARKKDRRNRDYDYAKEDLSWHLKKSMKDYNLSTVVDKKKGITNGNCQ